MKKTGRAQFSKYSFIINAMVAFFSIFGKRGNYFLLKFFRNTNGRIGLLLRYVYFKNCSEYLGNNVSVHPGVYLFNVNKIKIGNNVSIHPLCYIDGAGSIEIGSNVSIAHNCSILSTNHQWEDPDIPIKYNKESFGKVTICNDVWIGCGVRILAGIKVSERSIIAAGAVVTKDLAGNCLYGGVPAKLIKKIN